MTNLDDIKSRIDIVEYVSQFTQLKKAGYNYKGLCPFHREKTPSFMVSPDKQIAYCFGCRKGGDVFKFVMELEHVDFVDAMKSLAKRAGVQIEHFSDPHAEAKDRLYRMQEVAQVFFEEQLVKEGAEAQAYLTKRGISAEDIKTFGIGYAPDSYDALSRRLRDKGFTEAEIKQSGLVTIKESSAPLAHLPTPPGSSPGQALYHGGQYDKFRHRIMFPIRSGDGDIVAFAGRALRGDQQPKYLNSPETAIYHKGEILYNFSAAKEAIRERRSIIVAEGYLDVIALSRAGFPNVVAVCGTALTERQAKLLRRFADAVILCFDNDDAGMEATKRNAIPVLKEEMGIRAVDLKAYKDPDEFFRSDPEGLKTCVVESVNGMEHVMAKVLQKHNVEVPEGRRAFLRELAPLISAIPFVSEREVVVRTIADHLGTTKEGVAIDLSRASRPPLMKMREGEAAATPPGSAKRRSLLLGILLNHTGWMEDCMHEINEEMFASPTEKNVYSAVTTSYNRQVLIDKALEGLSEADRVEAHIWMLETEDEYAHWDEASLRRELAALTRYTTQEYRKQTKVSFLGKLRESEKTDPDAHWRLLQELNQQQ